MRGERFHREHPDAVLASSDDVRSLLLVRNGVDHDARVLRAARVARRALGGSALVVGAATVSAPAGEASVEGVPVLRLRARPPLLGRFAVTPGPSASARHGPNGSAPRQANGTAKPTSGNGPGHGPDGEAARLTAAGRARRTLSGLSFALQSLAVARRLRPRLVQANDWNTMGAGLLIKLLCGSRLVYDSHELWADRNGRWEWRPWLLACEALFVRAADEVLTSSPGYADALAVRYRIPRPAVVRNIPENRALRTSPVPLRRDITENPGPHEDLLAPANTDPVRRNRPTPPLVVYIGGLMPGRGLEQMIDALPLVPAARLRAVGPGTSRYRGSLLTRAEAAGVLDRVDLCSAIPPAAVPDALAEATAGLCLIQPICRSYELCLPNKLFEYAAAGVPVLASDLPVLGALVDREGFGTLAPAADPQAIAASLERLLEPDDWRLAAQRARAFSDTHSWAREALTLSAAYTRAAGTRDTGVPA